MIMSKIIYSVNVEITEVDEEGNVKHDNQDFTTESKSAVRDFIGQQFNRFTEVERVGDREW